MQRRTFLGAALGVTGGAVAGRRARAGGSGEDSGKEQEFYELRRYRLQSAEDRKLFDAYWRNAAIPAHNRLGVQPIGVFEPADDSKNGRETFSVLLPYRSLNHMLTVRRKLPQDPDYREAAEEYLNTPKKNPAYERIESKLMVAFAAHPRLTTPELTAQDGRLLYELRTYESHNERKARLKVEMFNKLEIDLFHDLGFPPAVFHGDTIVGDMLPNLSYMLVFKNRDQRDRLWDTFIDSDGWKKMAAMDRYKNTVSKVHNWFLHATEYSQI